jgi:hypothetical protein
MLEMNFWGIDLGRSLFMDLKINILAKRTDKFQISPCSQSLRTKFHQSVAFAVTNLTGAEEPPRLVAVLPRK